MEEKQKPSLIERRLYARILQIMEDKKLVWSEITNNGTLKVPTYKLIIFILKYVAPIAISVIFINELGLLK